MGLSTLGRIKFGTRTYTNGSS